VDSQFRPSRFPATFGAALSYVTLFMTIPAAVFTFLAFPKEVGCALVPACARGTGTVLGGRLLRGLAPAQ
jgi:hypothetical protein